MEVIYRCNKCDDFESPDINIAVVHRCAPKLEEAAPSASANTGSMPLCRTCIKLYACIKSGDNIDGCTEHEHYAPQQHAGA